MSHAVSKVINQQVHDLLVALFTVLAQPIMSKRRKGQDRGGVDLLLFMCPHQLGVKRNQDMLEYRHLFRISVGKV